jgi:hypothetical protein
MDSHRLRQMETQAGLNTIEVTGEAPPESAQEPWEAFRQSVADAAVPGCLSPDASVPRPRVQAQGLLRLPALVGAAAVGKCR